MTTIAIAVLLAAPWAGATTAIYWTKTTANGAECGGNAPVAMACQAGPVLVRSPTVYLEYYAHSTSKCEPGPVVPCTTVNAFEGMILLNIEAGVDPEDFRIQVRCFATPGTIGPGTSTCSREISGTLATNDLLNVRARVYSGPGCDGPDALCPPPAGSWIAGFELLYT